MTEQKKWNGSWPTSCDGCRVDLSSEPTFYDAKTASGRWGLFCRVCHSIFCGEALGTGLGQKYDSKTLVKIAG